MEPKVSIIIPVYNVEPFLARCLDSVVGQTLRGIEIICVDDGSPDRSIDILNRYAAQDDRIRVISQENRAAFEYVRDRIVAELNGEVAEEERITQLDSLIVPQPATEIAAVQP